MWTVPRTSGVARSTYRFAHSARVASSSAPPRARSRTRWLPRTAPGAGPTTRGLDAPRPVDRLRSPAWEWVGAEAWRLWWSGRIPFGLLRRQPRRQPRRRSALSRRSGQTVCRQSVTQVIRARPCGAGKDMEVRHVVEEWLYGPG